MLVAIGLGLVSAVVGVTGAILVQREYEREQAVARAKEEAETQLRNEVADANARADAIEARRRRQIRKLATVSERVAQFIDAGAGIRNKLLGAQASDHQFEQLFDQKYAGTIETWRGEVARMLDEEFPALHLGKQFSAVDGVYIGSKSAFGLSRLMNCISSLRSTQSALPSLVERVTD